MNMNTPTKTTNRLHIENYGAKGIRKSNCKSKKSSRK